MCFMVKVGYVSRADTGALFTLLAAWCTTNKS